MSTQQETTGLDGAAISDRVRAIATTMALKPVDEVTRETRLVDNLGYDSLRLLELAIALEMEFGLTGISADETVSITTVGGVEDFIAEALARQA